MQSHERIRPAAVAGMFYPGDAKTLAGTVDALLEEAASAAGEAPGPVPKALIVPHAGYVYSGPIAATAYARLVALRGRIRRVVLLGPAHREWIDGMALPEADALETPLGRIPVDADAVRTLARFPEVVVSGRPHAQEHSLEVQLPFVQRVLGDVPVVPIVVGGASPEAVARVLDALWGGDETLILVSSDLSHYLSSDEARDVDRDTARSILGLHADVDHDHACGATPVDGLLLEAKRRGMRTELLDLRNSGDTAGSRDRVVGYGAFAFHSAPTARSGGTA